MNDTRELPASSTLQAFLGYGVDRCAFIDAWLRARSIPHSVVDLAGKRHIVVRFEGDAYDPLFRMKTLVAHYDRVEGSPGANDNSAACFQLMLFAQRLALWQTERPEGCLACHNIRIIFTDGEEAAGTKGVAGQGAYALGSAFRRLKMTDDDVYVFDATGSGDTLILSSAGMSKKGRIGERLALLHERAAAQAAAAAPGNWLRLRTPYSDNAGFLAAGIASQVFTVLPREEAHSLVNALSSGDPSCAPEDIERAITGKGMRDPENRLARVIPKTWRVMHTAEDTASALTADAFRIIDALLYAIACANEPST